MSIYLGNIQFDQVEEKLGYRLNEDDRKIWLKYHSQKADLNDNTFHVFNMPLCIHFKGQEAKNAILKMFTPDKITKTIGEFRVHAVK